VTTYLVRSLDLDEFAGVDTLLEGCTHDVLLDLLLLNERGGENGMMKEYCEDVEWRYTKSNQPQSGMLFQVSRFYDGFYVDGSSETGVGHKLGSNFVGDGCTKTKLGRINWYSFTD
jgi:hypothetical protein